MRPIVALVGTIILVALLVLTYFVVPTASGREDVSSTQPVSVTVPSGGTFLSSITVTVNYANLPRGDTLTVIPCANEGASASSCLAAKPGWTVEGGTSGTLSFQINVGHFFLVTTNSPPGAGTSFTTSIPFWSVETTYLLVGTIVGLLLAGIGMIRTPEEKYGVPMAPRPAPAPASGATPRPFCENCGQRYETPDAKVCGSCGTPRGN